MRRGHRDRHVLPRRRRARRPRPGAPAGRRRCEPGRDHAAVPSPRLVRARHPRHSAGHDRRSHRRRHPRQEPPPRWQLLPARRRVRAGHADGPRAGVRGGRPRALLGHGRRDGTHRRRDRGDRAAPARRDHLGPRRYRAHRRPGRRHEPHGGLRPPLPLLGRLGGLHDPGPALGAGRAHAGGPLRLGGPGRPPAPAGPRLPRGHPAARARGGAAGPAQPPEHPRLQRGHVPAGAPAEAARAPADSGLLPSPRRRLGLEPPLRASRLRPVPVRSRRPPRRDRAGGGAAPERGAGALVPRGPEALWPGQPRPALVPHTGLDAGARPPRRAPGARRGARSPRRPRRRGGGPGLPGQGLAAPARPPPDHVPPSRGAGKGAAPSRPRGAAVLGPLEPARPRPAGSDHPRSAGSRAGTDPDAARRGVTSGRVRARDGLRAYGGLRTYGRAPDVRRAPGAAARRVPCGLRAHLEVREHGKEATPRHPIHQSTLGAASQPITQPSASEEQP